MLFLIARNFFPFVQTQQLLCIFSPESTSSQVRPLCILVQLAVLQNLSLKMILCAKHF